MPTSPWTLSKITMRVARALGILQEGSATGGSATTIVDSLRLLGNFGIDDFKLGTAWITYDAGGAGAAPEGEWGRVSAYTPVSGTVTLSASLTAAVASGDRYALATKRYTLDAIISAINQVLDSIPIRTEDKSLTTASGQTEYTLPAGVLVSDDIELYLQTFTGDSDDNRWMRIYDFEIEETGTGTQKTLVLGFQPPAAYVMKLSYWTPHPSLYAYNSKLREEIPIDRVVYAAALQILYYERSDMAMVDPRIRDRIATLEGQLGRVIKGTSKDMTVLAHYGQDEWEIGDWR